MKKSEKEKMLAGEYYNAMDEDLVEGRDRARVLTYTYNHAAPNEVEKKKSVMKEMIKTKGAFNIEAPFICDYGYNIEVGNNFYANFGCILLDTNKIIIGENVLLAPNVQMYTAAHPVNPQERKAGKEYALPIVIKDNVWIGGGAIICPGVTIGENSIIGAGSVVTKDIPANVVAVGNPCKVSKEILD